MASTSFFVPLYEFQRNCEEEKLRSHLELRLNDFKKILYNPTIHIGISSGSPKAKTLEIRAWTWYAGDSASHSDPSLNCEQIFNF